MNPLRALNIIAALVLGATLPSVVALGYHLVTGDPTFRPLGITETALNNFNVQQSNHELEVRIFWGTGNGSRYTKSDVTDMFNRAFRAKNVNAVVRYVDAPGSNILVYYMVEQDVVGPYQMAKAANGIPNAVALAKSARN